MSDRNEWVRLRAQYGVRAIVVSKWQGWMPNFDLEKLRRILNLISLTSIVFAVFVAFFTDLEWNVLPSALFAVVTTGVAGAIKAYQAAHTQGATMPSKWISESP